MGKNWTKLKILCLFCYTSKITWFLDNTGTTGMRFQVRQVWPFAKKPNTVSWSDDIRPNWLCPIDIGSPKEKKVQILQKIADRICENNILIQFRKSVQVLIECLWGYDCSPIRANEGSLRELLILKRHLSWNQGGIHGFEFGGIVLNFRKLSCTASEILKWQSVFL